MLDRLTGMAVFVKAADTGSFAAAATALRLSPQMVAKHVSALENRLGARLLNRTTRRQSLTEMGAMYYERCQLILAETEEADSLAAVQKGTPRGRLRVTAPVTFGAHSVAPLVAAYLQAHPEVTVELELTDRLIDIVDEGFEMAFRIGAAPPSGLVARPLAPYQLIACASHAYLEKHGVPLTPSDLEHHECLGYSFHSRPVENLWRFTRDGISHTVNIQSRMLVNDGVSLLNAARKGFGIVMGGKDLIGESMLKGEVAQILSDYEAPLRPIHLLFSPDKRQTPKIRSFIDTAMSALG